MFNIVLVWMSIFAFANAQSCKPSVTTVSGPAAPISFCSGDLVYEESFSTFDKGRWQHEKTLGGGGNGEFQWYDVDVENSFSKNGKLYIKPTLTAAKIGYDEVENGHISLDGCTDEQKENCERQAGENRIINPVRSARLNTKHSFSFKYGHVEVIAKMPEGDWLWPAIWLLPTRSKYGGWPNSGEIDLLESRGNRKYTDHHGNQIGVEQVSSTLHFGPRWDQDAYITASYTRNNVAGYHNDFHKYELIWNENGIKFLVDGYEHGFTEVGDGFWHRGKFHGENIWANATKMAPFDEEFHFIINLAAGGTNGYFPDRQYKPWRNGAPTGMKDFWTNRSHWLSSWDLDGEKSSLIIDSVKVWAL